VRPTAISSTCVADTWTAVYGHERMYETQCYSLSGNALWGGTPRVQTSRDLWGAAAMDCGCGARDFITGRDGRTRCSYCHGQPRLLQSAGE
jgi:hypothetical protein